MVPVPTVTLRLAEPGEISESLAQLQQQRLRAIEQQEAGNPARHRASVMRWVSPFGAVGMGWSVRRCGQAAMDD